MKSVIHVNDKITIAGGVEVYVSQIQPLLRELGWRSEWVGMSRSGQRLKIESDNKEFRWDGLLRDFSSSPVAEFMREGLVHLHSISDPVLIRALLAIAPVVRTMHEPRMVCPGHGKFWAKDEQACTEPMGPHCLLHAYTKKCCNRHPKRLIPAYQNTRFEIKQASNAYARIIANSRYIRDEAIMAGIAADQISLLHYFTPTTESPQEAPKRNRIVYTGRLSRTKGVHYLLRSFDLVGKAHPSAHLDLLGDGQDAAEFQQLAADLGLNSCVTFHGWADRTMIDDYLNRASVVAFPSIYPEAFGISGIEAMMRGKPVVGFDVGGVSDWLDNGVTGILVPSKDVAGYANALSELLASPDKAQAYGRAGRLAALDRFSPEVHLAALTKTYAMALQAGVYSL